MNGRIGLKREKDGFLTNGRFGFEYENDGSWMNGRLGLRREKDGYFTNGRFKKTKKKPWARHFLTYL